MVINIDTKGMFIEGNLARESVLNVVVTADLNQTIWYLITTTFGDVLCLYQSFNLLRQSSVRRYSAFEENFLWFHLPQSAVLNALVFWVSLLGIPKTLGIWVRGYPKHGGTQITVTRGTGKRPWERGCCLSPSIVLNRYFHILVNSMTIWSVLKLPKIAWPSPFKLSPVDFEAIGSLSESHWSDTSFIFTYFFFCPFILYLFLTGTSSTT